MEVFVGDFHHTVLAGILVESVTGLEPKATLNRIEELVAATKAEHIPKIQEALALIADCLLINLKPVS